MPSFSTKIDRRGGWPGPMCVRTLAASLVLGLVACGKAESRLSVILISIDTLRADHLGLYGYSRQTSPFLDRWSHECLVFERAFSPYAWTLPAHMSMLTGLFPAQHGIEKEELALASGIPLVGERLRAAGYRTVGLYFQSYVHERYGFGRGFDVFRRHEDVEEAGEHLREELARLDPRQPFFLFVHLFDVHAGPFPLAGRAVYQSPPPYQDLFLPDAAARLPAISYPEFQELELSDEEIEAVVALYDGGIRHVDAELEEWFGMLEREGWLDDALVTVTSDHGESLAQHGRKAGRHGGFYNEGLHVPLILRTPAAVGRRVRQPVHLVDIVPTILEVAGLPGDPLLPGHSLLSELPNGRVLTGSRSPGEYVLRWPRKILRTGEGRCWGVDLEQDPGELRPVAVPPEIFDELRAEAFPADRRFEPPVPLGAATPEELEELRALGYGGDADEQ